MKIKKLYIEAFRGIPKSLELDFSNRNGDAVSSIIYGDNGTGKSSIVDAIEYNLQARIERDEKIKNSRRPSAISKFHTKSVPAKTKVELDNGEIVERGIDVIVKEDKVLYRATNKDMNDHFSYVPIALRRNDIMTYNILSGIERQILFFKFIYHVPDNIENDSELLLEIDPEIEDLQEECIRIKRRRDELKQILGNKIGVAPSRFSINDKEAINLCIKRNIVIRNGNPRQKTQGRKLVSQEEYDEIVKISNALVERLLEIKMIKGQIKKLTDTSSIKSNKRLKQNMEFLTEASLYLTEAFLSISSVDYVNEIHLSFGKKTDTSLEILVKLKNGLTATPSSIFSEANYDLLILLLYISIIRVGANRGQAKVFILDDVLQSVDTQIRAKFVSYILSELKDWQIIITAHDRLWLNQLRYLFANNGHEFKELQITNWSFDQGPVVVSQSVKMYDDFLEIAIKSGNTTLMATTAGLMLEKICQNLSIELRIDIKRVRDDKYTIGDLWPGIRKQLKKSKELETLVESINNSLYIRNLLACHYNEWAIALSDQEIREFAYNVQKLYEKSFCQKCLSWISSQNSSQNTYAQCKCHYVSVSKST